MPIKNDLDSNPLPYCHIPRSMKNYNLNLDNCFSPQAKNLSPIFSPRRATKSAINVAGGGGVSYPYYMPKEWFPEEPPMGIQVEEQEEGEKKDEIISLSNLSMPVNPPLVNLVGETTVERSKGRALTSRGVGHHRPVDELTHRLERFKIKTLQLGGGGGVKK